MVDNFQEVADQDGISSTDTNTRRHAVKIDLDESDADQVCWKTS